MSVVTVVVTMIIVIIMLHHQERGEGGEAMAPVTATATINKR